jgi:hypothetical protein
MARDRDDDPLRRQREREEEKEREEREELAKPTQSKIGSVSGGSEKLIELMERAEPMIEQLTHLYNMYIAGAEQQPPLERRKQLDQIMNTIFLMSKPTPSLQFRSATMLNHYNTNRERWDRMLKDLESGKIKRTAGPKRGR